MKPSVDEAACEQREIEAEKKAIQDAKAAEEKAKAEAEAGKNSNQRLRLIIITIYFSCSETKGDGRSR